MNDITQKKKIVFDSEHNKYCPYNNVLYFLFWLNTFSY